jgi:putative flippase GtrA
MPISKKDWSAITIIGAAIGLLVQPILGNVAPTHHFSVAVRVGIFFFFLIIAPLALFIAHFIAKWWAAFYQFSKFAAVGVLNSCIDIGVLNLETFLYGSAPIGAGLFALFKAISFLCATTNSFAWNKYWTFNTGDKAKASEVAGFYTVAVVGWVVNVGVATLVKSLGPDTKLWVNIIAPVAGIGITFIWNFIGYKYFVFKKQVVPAAKN